MDKLQLVSLSQWLSRTCGSALLVLASLLTIQSMLEGSFRLDNLIVASILFLFGLGLLKCWDKARQLLAAVLLISAIVTPIGIINPFNAGDQLAQVENAYPVVEILAWLLPLEIFLLLFAWLLDLPFKKEA